MKNDLIVFTGGKKAYAPKRLSYEANILNINLKVLLYRDLTIKMDQTKIVYLYNGHILPESKSIFMRGLGEDAIYSPIKYYLISYYESLGGKVLNGRSFVKWPSLDKTVQHLEFQKKGIPIVESYVFGSREEAMTWVDRIGYPLIVKNNIGSGGSEVYKIESKKDFEKLLSLGYSLIKIKSLLFQKFLKAGEDLRVIVINGKVVGAMKRIAKPGSFLTNFSQGGEVVPYEIEKDSEAKELALKVANLFLLDYCGVDLMRNEKGKWVVIEVNRACQFQGFEKATKINVAKKIIDYLVFDR